MLKLKDLKSVEKEVREKNDPSYQRLFKATEESLIHYGFGRNLNELGAFLESDPHCLQQMTDVYEVVLENRTTLIVTNDLPFVWNFYAYFPVLYSINNLGKSIYRTTISNLMNRFLDKGDADRNLEIKQYLNLFSSIFYADARLSSMSQSIDNLITQCVLTTASRKVIITATSPFIKEDEIVRDITHRLETVYSPELSLLLQQKAHLHIIKEPFKRNASWQRN